MLQTTENAMPLSNQFKPASVPVVYVCMYVYMRMFMNCENKAKKYTFMQDIIPICRKKNHVFSSHP